MTDEFAVGHGDGPIRCDLQLHAEQIASIGHVAGHGEMPSHHQGDARVHITGQQAGQESELAPCVDQAERDQLAPRGQSEGTDIIQHGLRSGAAVQFRDIRRAERYFPSRRPAPFGFGPARRASKRSAWRT